jgi:winged helix domain-containing protein
MTRLKVKIVLGAGQLVLLVGRAAWTLRQLIQSGPAGCSVFDIPAPRWSGYVHKLRKLGFMIDTIRERHRGRFPGHHARYVLRSCVVILEETGF